MGKQGVLIYRCRQCLAEGERRTKDVDEAIADVLLHRLPVGAHPVTWTKDGKLSVEQMTGLAEFLSPEDPPAGLEFQPPRVRHTDCLGAGNHGIADVVGCRVDSQDLKEGD